MLEPAAGMSPIRVVVCPMNCAPFRVPFVLPTERHLVSFSQARYSRGDIDIVGDEQGLARSQFQNETLVPAAIAVIRKYPFDYSPAFDLKFAAALFEGAAKDLVAFGARSALCSCRVRQAAKNASPD